MVPLSSNDWPTLSTNPRSNPLHQPIKVTQRTNAPQIRPSNAPSQSAPFQHHPPALPPLTSYIAPPPGLQNHQMSNVYPQHPQEQVQYQQNQMYNSHNHIINSTPVYITFNQGRPLVLNERQMTSTAPVGQNPSNVKYPVQVQSNGISHLSNHLPRLSRPPPMAPPGLVLPKLDQNEASPAVPMLKRPTTSSDQASSSVLDRDGQSTTLTSPNLLSSPPTQSNTEPADKESATDGPMDKYAPTYVPSWLRQVNEEVQFTLVPLPAEPNYDYDTFVSCFLPRSLVFSDPDDEDKASSGDRRNSTLGNKSEESKDLKDDTDLIKVDSSWLRGEEGDALEELEEPSKIAEDEEGRDNHPAHVSIGANSQGLESNDVTAKHDSSPIVLHKMSDIRQLSAPLPPLGPETYNDRLKKLLEVEYSHRRDMLTAQSLYDVQLSVYAPTSKIEAPPWSKDSLYSLRLPGVREDYPNLVPGDLLQLRVLASHVESWLRIAFEAKVHVVHKVAGLVIIKCDALANQLKTAFKGVESARFNILFSNSAFRGSTEMLGGIERIGKYLKRSSYSKPGQVLRRWLFPTLKDQEVRSENSSISLRQSNIRWYDANLNSEQKSIASSIVHSQLCKIPYLIHGPPGTGKTKTLVETTLQILQHHSKPRILLTAPSVTAADTLALRLAPHLKPQEMTRINDPRRTFEEVPEALLIYCSIEETINGSSRFGLPEWDKLMKSKVVIMATQDIHILHLCKVSNLELGRWQGVTLSAMFEDDRSHPVILHWTHLIVDEAGQSSEAEIANALLLVVPSTYHDVEASLPVVVLCGDVAQLGPQIDSHLARSHGLDISLLERLSKRKVYHRQLSLLRSKARQALMRGDFGPGGMGQESDLTIPSGSAAHLVRNYRARNASLLHVVSTLFYDDCLLPCALPSTLKLDREIFPNGQVPFIFEHVNSKDEWVDEGASFYNGGEIEKVVELCKLLTKQQSSSFSPKDIAVITPYREQVWRIRIKLRKVGLAGISVGNVEVYQGAEHKVTILSTVRSSSRFLEMDAKRSLGLVYERKRLCVALSRAQEALVVVGNGALLRMDPYWRTFISYAKRNLVIHGEIGGYHESVGEDTEQLGALEYASQLDKAPTEHDTAYLAGRMAASALYEEEDEEEDDDDDDDAVR